jgi:hypothetical protein
MGGEWNPPDALGWRGNPSLNILVLVYCLPHSHSLGVLAESCSLFFFFPFQKLNSIPIGFFFWVCFFFFSPFPNSVFFFFPDG